MSQACYRESRPRNAPPPLVAVFGLILGLGGGVAQAKDGSDQACVTEEPRVLSSQSAKTSDIVERIAKQQAMEKAREDKETREQMIAVLSSKAFQDFQATHPELDFSSIEASGTMTGCAVSNHYVLRFFVEVYDNKKYRSHTCKPFITAKVIEKAQPGCKDEFESGSETLVLRPGQVFLKYDEKDFECVVPPDEPKANDNNR